MPVVTISVGPVPTPVPTPVPAPPPVTSARGRAPVASSPVRPRLTDVAAAAGVSLKTASRALNGEPHVTEQTAAKVLAAARDLGFRPNAIARELRLGARSSAVGLIIGDVANPFYAGVAGGVERRLRREGMQLVTASSDEDPELERALTAQLLERRVAGLLITTCTTDHGHLELDRRHGVPVGFLDRAPAGPAGAAGDSVVLDNEVGARAATRHLLAHGHRRIALVGDLGHLTTHQERVAGFTAELAAAGVAEPARWVHADSHDSASAARTVAALLAGDEPPTALFTTNNRITVGALRVLHALPDDRPRPALVGFDDVELADLLGVTVIRHSPERLGEVGAERLLARLAGDTAPPAVHRIPVELVARGSGERPPA